MYVNPADSFYKIIIQLEKREFTRHRLDSANINKLFSWIIKFNQIGIMRVTVKFSYISKIRQIIHDMLIFTEKKVVVIQNNPTSTQITQHFLFIKRPFFSHL